MKKIIKRDGRVVNFNVAKIYDAILDAFDACEKNDKNKVEKITDEVVSILDKKFVDEIPYVEDVQDLIETLLIKHKEADVAKAFILYRHERTRARNFRNGYYNKVLNSLALDYSKNDLFNSISDEILRAYYMDYGINKNLVKLVDSAEIYVQNLSTYSLFFEDETIDISLIQNLYKDNKNITEINYQILKFIKDIYSEISGSLFITNFNLYIAKVFDIFKSKIKLKEEVTFFLKTLELMCENNNKLHICLVNNDENYELYARVILDIISENNFSNILFEFENYEPLNKEFYKNFYLSKILLLNEKIVNKKTLFTYVINAVHLPNNFIDAKTHFENIINVIVDSVKERLESIKNQRSHYEHLSLYNKEENFEDLVKKFNVNISFAGFYEYLERNKEINKVEFIKFMIDKLQDLSKKSEINLCLVNYSDIFANSILQAKDKKNGNGISNFNYSYGLLFPCNVKTDLETKLSYENNDIEFYSPSIVFVKKSDFTVKNYERIINELKKNKILSYTIFVDNSDESNEIIAHYPLFKINPIKVEIERYLSESFIAKPLIIDKN